MAKGICAQIRAVDWGNFAKKSAPLLAFTILGIVLVALGASHVASDSLANRAMLTAGCITIALSILGLYTVHSKKQNSEEIIAYLALGILAAAVAGCIYNLEAGPIAVFGVSAAATILLAKAFHAYSQDEKGHSDLTWRIIFIAGLLVCGEYALFDGMANGFPPLKLLETVTIGAEWALCCYLFHKKKDAQLMPYIVASVITTFIALDALFFTQGAMKMGALMIATASAGVATYLFDRDRNKDSSLSGLIIGTTIALMMVQLGITGNSYLKWTPLEVGFPVLLGSGSLIIGAVHSWQMHKKTPAPRRSTVVA